MAESAKLLVDDVLQGYPVRQWVLSLPIPLRLLLARYPKELSKVMQIIHRAIATAIIHRAGCLKKQANTGAVTYIQRFGSALNLNIHLYSGTSMYLTPSGNIRCTNPLSCGFVICCF
ncbi:hypothetical protein [Glaciecola sp. KUL10]|uniref:hypothetical protein n=1 Tax=Glaciecola sp. (strain KUL10) TaxID=2161813 RepID=UPI000D84BE88|nr:hypothetical protein [Glaciecola sp. KUL10]GBL05518.1 transposase [Glaciecola sp. KUL10]